MAGRSRILSVQILTDASRTQAGLTAASAKYGKFAQALGTQSSSAGVVAGNALVNGIDKVLGVGVKVAAGAAAVVAGTALVKGFQRLNAIDQATAKLNGLGHSAGTVQKIMDNALAAVKGTSFGLGEAANTAAQVVAAGIKPGRQLQSVLTTVADTATIAGVSMDDMGSIFAKVAAKNKLQGDVINQLTSAGIPVLELLAQHYGVTAEAASSMVTKGQVDFASFAAAMKAGMGGAALESGKTFTGAWQNTLAALGRIGANLLSPLFQGAKDGLAGLPELLEPVERWAKDAGNAIANLSKWAKENAGWLKALGVAAAVTVGILLTFRAVVAVMSAYRAVMAVVQAAQLGYAAASYASAGASYAGAAGTLAQNFALVAGKVAFLAVTGALKVAAAAQWVWNAAMAGNPIVLIILAIVALVAAFVILWNTSEGFRNFWIGLWGAVQAVVATVVSWFTSAWSVAVAAVRGYVSLLIQVYSAVFSAIRSAVQAVTSFFSSAWSTAVNAAAVVIRTLQSVATAVLNAILTPIRAVASAFETVVGWVRQAIEWISRIRIPDVLGSLGGLFGARSLAYDYYPVSPFDTAGFRAGGGHHLVPRSLRPLASLPARAGGGETTVIQVYGGLDSADTIARRVDDVLERRRRRNRGVDLGGRSER